MNKKTFTFEGSSYAHSKMFYQFKHYFFLLLLVLFSSNLFAQTPTCYADVVIDANVVNCTNFPEASDPANALGAPNFTGAFSPPNPGEMYSLGDINSFLTLGFTDNALINDGSSNTDLFIYEVGPSVEETDIYLLPANAATQATLTANGMTPDGDGFFFFGNVAGATSAIDIDQVVSGVAGGQLVFNQIKLVNPIVAGCVGTSGPDIDAVCALSSITCPDADGDGVTTCAGDCNDNNPNINPNAPEICDGIDNNCDGNIDDGPDNEPPVFGDATSILLFEEDFENPNSTPAGGCYSDLNQFPNVNSLYGPGYLQSNTVETILINGPDNLYTDPSSTGDNYAIGMLATSEDDQLAFEFNTQGKNFLNLQMDFSAIAILGVSGGCNSTPFAANPPDMRVRLYDNPNNSFSFNNPGTLLSETIVTGNAPASDPFTFNWAQVIAGLDASAASNGNVVIEFNLLTEHYGAFDNFVMSASDVSIVNSCPEDVTLLCVSDVPAPTTPTATDNCDSNPTVTFNESEVVYNANDRVITRTWTATDAAGNMSECVQTITVEDMEVPMAVCQDFTVTLDNNGNATIEAANIDGGSADACNFTLAASPTTFDCGNVGDNNVTLTVSDASGNSATCVAVVTVNSVDSDNDGFSLCDGDCDDNNPNVNPGAAEICDGNDNNCDGQVDNINLALNKPATASADADGNIPEHAFDGNPNTSWNAGDFPVQHITVDLEQEFTIGLMKLTLNQTPVISDTKFNIYFSDDGVNFGSPVDVITGTTTHQQTLVRTFDGTQTARFIRVETEESESFAAWFEIEVYAPDYTIFFADNDGDGFGNPDDCIVACDAPTGYVTDNTDCDDNNSSINPNAQEICGDGIDNNCDGNIDEGFDVDNDGFTVCEGDCDDNHPNVNPDAAEICDGIDNNCDGNIDKGFDLDGDGIADCFDNCPNDANPGQEDSDCDGVGDVCDVCDGGDDTVDNNNDGLPDCANPPAFEDIIDDWKCGNKNKKVFICHNHHNPHTICVSKNAISAHMSHEGDYLGPCGSANCDTQDMTKGDKNISFAASGQQLSVNLHWATNFNNQVEVYEIERSNDGKHFEPYLTTINENGNDKIAVFESKDNTPLLGYNFYRLRLRFSDGTEGISGIEQVFFQPDLNEVFVTPNPTENELFVNLRKYSGKTCNIQIINNLGQIISNQEITSLTAIPLSVDVSQLKEGFYFMNIRVEGFRAVTKRFVVARSGK